jgi:hypothetical protein
MTLDPMTRNAVPCTAVKILKTKKAARLGDKAVPIENAKNSVALTTETYCKLVTLSKHTLQWHVTRKQGFMGKSMYSSNCVPSVFRKYFRKDRRNKD